MEKRKPLIGITTNWRKPDEFALASMDVAYAESVSRAGGVPVLIPPFTDARALADMLDGLLIPGGADIDPRHYHEEPHPQTHIVNAPRFEQEWALLGEFEARQKPVFGICYGCQLLNVWRGGSLHQHLPDLPNVTLKHDHQEGEELAYHFVQIDPDSFLYTIVGQTPIRIVTAHHQAIKAVGRNLRAVATSPDGVLEAIEDPQHPFFVGVQWHPERDPTAPATQALFRAFVEACRQTRVGK